MNPGTNREGETQNVSPPEMAIKHVITIWEWYDPNAQRYKAKVHMQEWRRGQQYGGAVVTYPIARKGIYPDSWTRTVVNHVIKKFLSLLTYKIK